MKNVAIKVLAILSLLAPGAGAVAAATATATATATAVPPTLAEAVGFGSNPGHLRMFYYLPADLPVGAPLVVVAHGCLGTAQQIAEASGWPALADKFKIALLFPQTSKDNEPFAGCFRTWLAEHQMRDAGEPLSVRQMIDHLRTLSPISASRIYMAGVSSGGHLTQVMMAAYPDVIAAGAPQSSFPYKCAMAMDELALCAKAGRDYSARQWGDLVRSAHPGYAGPWPRVQLWHGGKDAVILAANLQPEVLQWTDVHGIDADPDQVDHVLDQPRTSYRSGDGVVQVQTVTVPSMGHAVAVDPGTGVGQCGAVVPYAEDHDICAAYWIGRFFGVVP